MQSSILDRIFPPSSPLLPQHSSRRSSPSPSPASSPLRRSRLSASVLSSSVFRPAPVTPSTAQFSDPLLPIERATKALQQTIQGFLDAQSEGLLSGLTAGKDGEEVSSNSSLTPTPTLSSTPKRSVTVPIRQPTPEKISLRGARRGLARSMHDLAALKQQEDAVLEFQLLEREEALGRVDNFISKRAGLESQITSISERSSSQNASSLRTEASTLDQQIRTLEAQLLELKARQRHVLSQAAQIESSIDSKLSSYKASLTLLDKDIDSFLFLPPIPCPLPALSQSPTSPESQSFYILPAPRRTLSMAQSHWQTESHTLSASRASTQHELSALRAGLKIWRAAVTDIQTFEADMRRQMTALSHPTTPTAAAENLHNLLAQMDTVTLSLAGYVDTARDQSWNLLLVALGAEIEAFRQGRDLLASLAGKEVDGTESRHEGDLVNTRLEQDSAGDNLLEPEGETELDMKSPDKRPAGDTDMDPGQTPDGKPEVPPPRLRRLESRSSSSEYEDPSPDFLVAHTHTDTDTEG